MSLIKTIKNSPEIRKIFGKREMIIIEKQLIGVHLKPSEKTRLSRDIRKKFEAIKKIIPFQEQFNLKHNSETKYIIKDALEEILKSSYAKRIKKIYLFGSTADKTQTLISDVDIAVEFDSITEKESTQFRIHIFGRVPKRVDIQVYNTLPEKIKKEIDSKGKVLWKKE